MVELTPEDKIVAKLSVFVEGIAQNWMSTENQRQFGREILEDLKALLK